MKKLTAVVVPFLLLLFALHGGSEAANGFLEKGITEYQAENYDEAIDLLLKAREWDSVSAQAAYYLALSYKGTGDMDKAEKHLRDAVSLDPSFIDGYAELIEVLVIRDDSREAMKWIEKSGQKGAQNGRIMYLKGLLLIKAGKRQDARDAFLRAGELEPTYKPDADFQIGIIHMQEKQYAAARDAFRSVIESGVTTPVGEAAVEYQKALSRVPEPMPVWQFTAGVAYQYDSNVVLQPSADVSPTGISNKSDSSIVATFRAIYSPVLDGPWFFNARFNFYSNTYRELNGYNLLSPSLTVNPGYRFEKVSLALPVTYNYVWMHEQGYLSSFVLRPTASISLGDGHTGQISAGYENRDFVQQSLYPSENRSGPVYGFSLVYFYQFADGKAMVSARYDFSREETDGVNWTNNGNRFNVNLLLPVMNRIGLILTGDAYLQDYSNVNTFYGVKRRDTTYAGSSTFVCDIYRKLNLNLQYTYVKANSNISVYEYNRNIFMAGFEYSF